MQIIQYMLITSLTPALVYGDNIYAYEGDTVNLPCNLTPTDFVTWLVPPNLQQYAVGKSVNEKAFPNFKLIRNENSTQILKIFNFTIYNQGQYRCQTQQKKSDINFNVFPAVNPTNMTISNETTSNEIIAVEGQSCQLICRVASGLPKETLSWSHAGKVLAEGGPGNISYSFIPTRYDDGKNFTCIAYRKSTHILSIRNISVSVYFQPNVIVNISPSDTVVEGNSLVISCIHDSNDKDATIRWIPECKETLEANAQCKIDSVKRTAAGTYTCEVDSKVGRVQNSTTLNLLYAPDISISALSINDSCIYLECIAKGIPDVPVFARWQHKSSLGTPIRLLENSSVLCIQPNSYKDHGLYICNVTNHIPNNGGEVWLQKTYNKIYSGRPFFTTRNKRVHYAAFRKLKKLYFYVVSGLKITINESKTFTSLPGINNISNCISSQDIDDVIYDINVKVTGYEIVVDAIMDDAEGFGNYTIHLANSAGTTEFEFEVKSAGPLSAPQNIKAVALDTQIIVKWTDNHDIGLQKTFFVEYRKHFESQWSRVSVEDKSTAIINGLQAGAVYFLRVYSKNAAGESSKSDVIIVKTEKHHSKVQVFTVELAMILGVMFLMMVMCWCGIKALKNKQRSSRNQDRGTLPCLNDETIIKPAHYDEIDSMYYNPINSTVSHRDTRNNAQDCTRQPLNANLEDWEANNISSRNVHCAIHQVKPSQENNSLRSSSDESYLVPCRNYIDLDNVKITENEHHDISIEETAINVDESSISSNNSETNIKIIRRYETFNVSDTNEHCYKKYNEIDVFHNQ